MASIAEKIDSRQISGDSMTYRYIVSGTDDESAAKSLVLSAAPGTASSLVRDVSSISLDPISIDSVTHQGQWECSIKYVTIPASSPPVTGDSSYQFDTGGGTMHITQSIATIHKYAPSGKTAPDFGGAIGATHDNVEGVDITVPVYTWSETHYIADASVNKAAYYALTGKVNNASFKGCAAGECLFHGASGSKRGGGDWEITFKFAASPNKSGISVGGISGISKKGWEYMWVRYADSEDTAAKAIVKKPVAVYIEKVYEEGNLAGLGIGTT